jgi:hypothetical protein
MSYLLVILFLLTLLGGFLALTAQEARTGRRYFATSRETLDRRVARIFFIIRHVDWSASLKDIVRMALARAIHDIAEGTLNAVRGFERLLTRAVRALREGRAGHSLPLQDRETVLSRTFTSLKGAVRRKPRRIEVVEALEDPSRDSA